MSAVSMKVTPASRAACTVATARSSAGWSVAPIDIGMAPRPMAETVNGPRVRVNMSTSLWRRTDTAGRADVARKFLASLDDDDWSMPI